MRRPTLERWLRRELLQLSGLEKFSLRRIAALAQNEKPRLKEPLFLWACLTNHVNDVYSLLYRNDFQSELESVNYAVMNIDLQQLCLSDENIDIVSQGYKKQLNSFKANYNTPETQENSKKLRWERSHQLQLEKGISNAEIYKALGLNPGNVNAYMKHGDVSKLSLENATAVMKYLMSA